MQEMTWLADQTCVARAQSRKLLLTSIFYACRMLTSETAKHLCERHLLR